ncbi:MAG: hypothetical protein ACE366_29135 [Bradymonadia bacterium]
MDHTQQRGGPEREPMAPGPFSGLVGQVRDLVRDLEGLIQDLMHAPPTRGWSRRGPRRPGQGRTETQHVNQRRGPRP